MHFYFTRTLLFLCLFIGYNHVGLFASEARKEYRKIKRLGEGTYGMVYLVRDSVTNKFFALKKMSPAEEEEGMSATTMREISILLKLDHPYIVKLTDVIYNNPNISLVFEYCPDDLAKFFKASFGCIDSEKIKSFLFELLQGVEYLHRNCIMHRDLKPANLLITESGSLKIADFGLARVTGIPVKKYSHEVCTPWYRSPDALLKSTEYGLALDMWSTGCIFAEMALGHPLFKARSEADMLAAIFKLLGTPRVESWPEMASFPGTKKVFTENPGLSKILPAQDLRSNSDLMAKIGEEGVDLLSRMLVYSPQLRITAAEALRHPYFTGLKPILPLPDSTTSPWDSWRECMAQEEEEEFEQPTVVSTTSTQECTLCRPGKMRSTIVTAQEWAQLEIPSIEVSKDDTEEE